MQLILCCFIRFSKVKITKQNNVKRREETQTKNIRGK
jgi:hypothetical protein